jgi:hypothetical protein
VAAPTGRFKSGVAGKALERFILGVNCRQGAGVKDLPAPDDDENDQCQDEEQGQAATQG